MATKGNKAKQEKTQLPVRLLKIDGRHWDAILALDAELHVETYYDGSSAVWIGRDMGLAGDYVAVYENGDVGIVVKDVAEKLKLK